MKKTSTLLLFLVGWLVPRTQDLAQYEKQLFIRQDDTLQCRILTPQNFSLKKKYPLVVFLHGAGERGDDNEKQLTWGAELFLDSINRSRYPAIVIFPQCPENQSWAHIRRGTEKDSLGGFLFDSAILVTKPLQLVMDFIDTLVAHGNIDRQRIYVGGLSMGGFGTFDILWRRPDLFAAAFPICGGGMPEKAASMRKKIPVWVFHGDQDDIVPAAHSRRMVKALKAAGAEVRYTEYPGVGHDSWKNAFAEPQLMSWIFSKQMKK
jgi:predicted peptidase